MCFRWRSSFVQNTHLRYFPSFSVLSSLFFPSLSPFAFVSLSMPAFSSSSLLLFVVFPSVPWQVVACVTQFYLISLSWYSLWLSWSDLPWRFKALSPNNGPLCLLLFWLRVVLFWHSGLLQPIFHFSGDDFRSQVVDFIWLFFVSNLFFWARVSKEWMSTFYWLLLCLPEPKAYGRQSTQQRQRKSVSQCKD